MLKYILKLGIEWVTIPFLYTTKPSKTTKIVHPKYYSVVSNDKMHVIHM